MASPVIGQVHRSTILVAGFLAGFLLFAGGPASAAVLPTRERTVQSAISFFIVTEYSLPRDEARHRPAWKHSGMPGSAGEKMDVCGLSPCCRRRYRTLLNT